MSDKSNSGKEETEQAQCCDRGERQGGINSHCGNTVNLYGETGNGNCKDNDELVKSSSTSDGSVESSEVSAR